MSPMIRLSSKFFGVYTPATPSFLSATASSYYRCDGAASTFCDPALDDALTAARSPSEVHPHE